MQKRLIRAASALAFAVAVLFPAAPAYAGHIGTPTITASTGYATQGLVMGQTGKTVSVAVPVNDASVTTIAISTTATSGEQPLQLSASGHSASGAGTWTVGTISNGGAAGTTTISFSRAAGSTGTATFTLAIESVPRAAADRTDNFSIVPNGLSGHAVAGSLKRYSLEITSVSPPDSTAVAGDTLDPVMTVSNEASGPITLAAGSTSISGTAFSSTGTEGSMPVIGSDSTGTVTYDNAVITSSTGSVTLSAATGNGGSGTSAATAPSYSESVTVSAATNPSLSGTGTVTPNNSFSPAGLVMGSSSNTLTVPVTIAAVGTGPKELTQIKITSTESGSGSALVFQTSGSSGTGAGGSWTAASAGSGTITFNAPSGVTTGTATFTVSISSVPALSDDGTDSISAAYVTEDSTEGGAAGAVNTLKRYGLQVTSITPPSTVQNANVTVDPVMTVENETSGSVTLSAGSTSISGSAFSSTGVEGSMPTIPAGSSGTVSYDDALVTGSVGSKTVEGDAGVTSSISAPHFSSTVTVGTGVLPSFSGIGSLSPNNSIDPPGFFMGTSSNTVTVPVTIDSISTGTTLLDQIKITSNESGGGSDLVFETAGSSGTGAGGTWTATSAGTGQIFFDAPSGLETGTVTFTLSLSSVPVLTEDGHDSIVAQYVTAGGTTGGTTTSSVDLTRYALEITDLSPPEGREEPGDTVTPVMTVKNYSSAPLTLTTTETSISGSAFSSTGTEGGMPTIASGGTGTVTYRDAVLTSSTGDQDIEGHAGSTTDIEAPEFNDEIHIDDGEVPTLTITSPDSAITVGPQDTVEIEWESDEDGEYDVLLGSVGCTGGTELADGEATGDVMITTEIEAEDLAEGANAITICLTDGSDDTGSIAVPTITKDLDGPDGVVTSMTVVEDRATAVFTSSSAGSTFECAIDDAALASCTSPWTTSGLTAGEHTFKLEATDSAGNPDANATTLSFVARPSSDKRAEFVYTVATAGSTVTTDQEIDDATEEDPLELTVTTPVAGPVTIQEIFVTGSSDRWSEFVQRYEISFPETTKSAPARIEVRVDDSEMPEDAKLEELVVARDGGVLTECTDPAGTDAKPDPCVFSVRQLSSEVGVSVWTSAASDWDFGIDDKAPVPPAFTATSPTSPADDQTPRLIGIAEQSSRVRIYKNARCDGRPVAAGSAHRFGNRGIEVRVAEGATERFWATAKDDFGHVSRCSSDAASYTDLDLGAPKAAVLLSRHAISPNNDGRGEFVEFLAKFDERATWTLSIFGLGPDTEPLFTRTGGPAGTARVRWFGRAGGGPLAEGRYSWTLTAADPFGNEMEPVPGHVEIDVTRPELSSLVAQPRRISAGSKDSVRIAATVSEAGQVIMSIRQAGRLIRKLPAIKVRKAGEVVARWFVSTADRRPAPPGEYTVQVTAVDHADNRARRVARVRVVR